MGESRRWRRRASRNERHQTFHDRERHLEMLLADAAGQIRGLSAMLVAKDAERPADVEDWAAEVESQLIEAKAVEGASDATLRRPR